MQDEKLKIQNILSDRLINFAVEIIRLSEKMNRKIAGRQIVGQLIRSSTSAGANYEEACGAESLSDFIHQLHIVLKELRESNYWLRLISKAGLTSAPILDSVLQEANELANIIAKSIITAKKKQ